MAEHPNTGAGPNKPTTPQSPQDAQAALEELLSKNDVDVDEQEGVMLETLEDGSQEVGVDQVYGGIMDPGDTGRLTDDAERAISMQDIELAQFDPSEVERRSNLDVQDDGGTTGEDGQVGGATGAAGELELSALAATEGEAQQGAEGSGGSTDDSATATTTDSAAIARLLGSATESGEEVNVDAAAEDVVEEGDGDTEQDEEPDIVEDNILPKAADEIETPVISEEPTGGEDPGGEDPGGEDPGGEDPGGHLRGTKGDDVLIGTEGDDQIHGYDGDDLLVGKEGDDDLRGNHGDDLLQGGEGDDSLRGHHGDDVLMAGEGDDELRGGQGDDLLIGGEGDDFIDGGQGTDRAVFDGDRSDFDVSFDKGEYTVTDLETGETDTLKSVEEFQFGDGVYDEATILAETEMSAPLVDHGQDWTDMVQDDELGNKGKGKDKGDDDGSEAGDDFDFDSSSSSSVITGNDDLSDLTDIDDIDDGMI